MSFRECICIYSMGKLGPAKTWERKTPEDHVRLKKWVTCRFHVHLPGCKLINNNWVVVSNIFYVHPYLGKIPILTKIFQRG